MQFRLHTDWRNSVIFALLIIMMASLFFSRALLSVAMILFFLAAILHKDIKSHLRNFLSSPLLWGMSLLFMLPFISGIWSEDKQHWLQIIRIKLPLLVLPLAFAGPFNPGKKKWEGLAYIFIILVTAGTAWCMFHYTANLAAINESYLRAKSIRTPLENDHVRFSWMVCTGILLAAWTGWHKRKTHKKVSYILFFLAAWLIVFLHILAARTGLFSFYLMVILTALWGLFKKSRPRYSIVLILAVILLPLTAYFILPTFHNRVRYFLYEFEYFKKTNYLPGANDAVRMISLKAGWNVLNDNPVTGTGFGDIDNKTREWYQTNYPSMLERDKIYPSSEWLIYGVGMGWPGVFLFTIIMLIPFFIRIKNKQTWGILNLTAATGFLFDIGLEVQFGVFLYSFIILWWWKWLKDEKV